jgi:hypothetical protein
MRKSIQNNTIWEAAVLVLLIGVIYKVHRWDHLTWHDTHTKCFEVCFGNSRYIKVNTATFWDATILVLQTG